MAAMRILHVVGRSHRRGAEQVAVELATELERLGTANRLRAVSLGKAGERDAALPPLVDSTSQRPLSLARAVVALRRELRARPVDVILGHGSAGVFVAALARRRRGPAVVWQTISELADQTYGAAQRAVWQVALRRIDGVVELTPALGAEVRRLGYRGPLWPLPNARRTDRFEGLDRTEAARLLRAELSLPSSAVLLGLVGYLAEEKRPELAVAVLAAVRARGVDAHLALAGSGPSASLVGSEAARLGVADQAHLLGHRTDVEAVLGGIDVLLLTSRTEGIPGVLIEAAMAACPVVTVPVGSVAEVVLDGETGVVTADDDAGTLAAAVVDLVADPARLTALGERARERSSRYSMAAVARRYRDLLRSVATMPAADDREGQVNAT